MNTCGCCQTVAKYSLSLWFSVLVSLIGGFVAHLLRVQLVERWANQSLVNMAHWTDPWQFEKQFLSFSCLLSLMNFCYIKQLKFRLVCYRWLLLSEDDTFSKSRGQEGMSTGWRLCWIWWSWWFLSSELCIADVLESLCKYRETRRQQRHSCLLEMTFGTWLYSYVMCFLNEWMDSLWYLDTFPSKSNFTSSSNLPFWLLTLNLHYL